MIMHPHFEYFPTNTKASAKPLDLFFQIFPLQSPPQLLRKAQHFLLLLLREFRSEPLLTTTLRRVRRHLLPPRRSTSAAAGVVYDLIRRRMHVAEWGSGDFPVEVAVAAARSAGEAGGGGGVFVGCEFAAAVGGVAAETGCMVP